MILKLTFLSKILGTFLKAGFRERPLKLLRFANLQDFQVNFYSSQTHVKWVPIFFLFLKIKK